MNAVKVPYMPIQDFSVLDVEEDVVASEDDNNLKALLNELLDCSKSNRNSSAEVALILHGMGLEKYIEIFRNQKISFETFLHLTEQDLEKLGIELEDRKAMAENLKVHQKSFSKMVVFENHNEDLTIAKNVYNHLIFLQNYCSYIELQMKKHKLTDYTFNFKESAAVHLKMFTEAAITQSRLISERLFEVNSSSHLIGNVLKVNNLILPKHLEKKLKRKSMQKNKLMPKMITAIGLTSLMVLMGKYWINK